MGMENGNGKAKSSLPLSSSSYNDKLAYSNNMDMTDYTFIHLICVACLTVTMDIIRATSLYDNGF